MAVSRLWISHASVKTDARIPIVEGPEAEVATNYLTVIGWRINNPGGSPVHYGIVRYGTRSDRLTEMTESPIRLDPTHRTVLFRVRLTNLKEKVTYYFETDSMGADGKLDGEFTQIEKFALR